MASDTNIDMEQDITFHSMNKVILKRGTSIGGYQVATGGNLQEAVGNWSLTLSPKAMTANVSRILVIYRYVF